MKILEASKGSKNPEPNWCLLQDASFQYNQNEPVVAFSFNKKGSDLFAKMTTENVDSRFALFSMVF